MVRERLATVVDGSLIEGLEAKLDDVASIERIRAGKFVVIEGTAYRFFSLITDVQLRSSTQKMLMDPPSAEADAFVRSVLSGTTAYGVVRLSPMLMLPVTGGFASADAPDLQPVRTIPSHFCPVYEADAHDFSAVFGSADDSHFPIGKPLDNDVPLCLDLRRFVERSNGVFGKSGTGKSFLTRILLCGLIERNICGNLIFDMHNEYGWSGTAEGGAGTVKGLKQLFGSRILIYTLDKESSARRGVQPDSVVTIDASEIGLDDLTLLSRELNISEAGLETCALLERKFGSRWLTTLTDWENAELDEHANDIGLHPAALSAVWRKLAVLRKKPYITWHGRPQDITAKISWDSLGEQETASSRSIVKEMLDQIASGRHIVLEFGRHLDTLSYMLVASIITRAVRNAYVEATERHQNSQLPQERPRQLMITIEEAHNFLSQEAARSTTFGQIAREMRKYSVTLLVVDQRPSGIDTEVLSQIGTRITCLLDDERDVDAVLNGISGARQLRSILATLEAKQQAMLIGYATPMPIVLATRSYDASFFSELSKARQEPTAEKMEATMRKLFPR